MMMLILAIISLLSTTVLSSEWLVCDPPKSLAIELENGRTLFVYDAEVKVKYERDDLSIYEYPLHEDVNILVNNTIVSFSGYIQNDEFNTDTTKLFKTFNSKIAGFARLRKNNDTLTDYSLYLSRSHDEEVSRIPKKVQIEIIHEAVNCVRLTIDEKIGRVKPEDLERGRRHPYDFGSISVKLGNATHLRFLKSFNSKDGKIKHKITEEEIKLLLKNVTTRSSVKNEIDDLLQRAINEVVDLAVAVLTRKINEKNEGRIKIPNLYQNFTTGSSWWKTNGDFDAYDGTFEDLTTLSRTKNVSLSRKGLNFFGSCNFGISTSNMNYRSYKLKYGIVKVNGKLSASIDGLMLFASGKIDFNRVPCETFLLDLRVIELGKIKVKMSGLGPLNKLLSKLVTWITKKWQDVIVVKVEDKLKEILTNYTTAFDCEKYRSDLNF